MKIRKVMLFAYDFPHKKTQDFIFRLFVEGYKIEYIIASPWIKLNIPKSSININYLHENVLHPKDIAQSLSVKYIVAAHNSQKSKKYLKNHPVDIYIISGARILDDEILTITGNKILNIHPGLLPDIRGLDTLLWSIYYDKPIGITSHLISTKIDLGIIVYKEKLKLIKGDNLKDISLRLLEKQNDILIKSLKILSSSKIKKKNINSSKTKYHFKMPTSLEKKVIKKFNRWFLKNK